MKIVLGHTGKYYCPMWANRSKNKVVWSFDSRLINAIIPWVREAHFTYPEDGDFHYTFNVEPNSRTGVRQFCDRIQYTSNGRTIKEVIRTPKNTVYDMQPLFLPGWKKLPLKEIKGDIVFDPSHIFGFGLPLEQSAAKNVFFPNRPKHKPEEFCDISIPDQGSFNCRFILRGKDARSTIVNRARFVVEDRSEEPIISLLLVYISVK